MSRWLRKTLQVELAPGQVNLVHAERRLTPRGVRTTVWNQRLPDVAAESSAEPWRGAVQALATALPTHAGHPARVSVILSSRLVRYTLVPWSDTLSDAAEETAFARHCFERVYGEAAAQWELRVSPGMDGAPMLASAVDTALLSALREAFTHAGVRLDSVQPNLMAVYNDYRGRLRGRHAWLALLEPGNLCLALLHQGRWARIRSTRVGPGWNEELPLVLEREAYLADPAAASGNVFLWASGLGDARLPENDRWQFHLLAARPRQGFTAPDAGRFLVAMEG